MNQQNNNNSQCGKFTCVQIYTAQYWINYSHSRQKTPNQNKIKVIVHWSAETPKPQKDSSRAPTKVCADLFVGYPFYISLIVNHKRLSKQLLLHSVLRRWGVVVAAGGSTSTPNLISEKHYRMRRLTCRPTIHINDSLTLNKAFLGSLSPQVESSLLFSKEAFRLCGSRFWFSDVWFGLFVWDKFV